MKNRALKFVLLIGVVSFLPTLPMRAPAASTVLSWQFWERVQPWSGLSLASVNCWAMACGLCPARSASVPANSGRSRYLDT